MDRDDPEERIAELERQLAEQKRTAEPDQTDERPAVSSADIRDVTFSKPARGHRGYDEDEVDEFLGRVEMTLCDPTAQGGVTSAEIDSVSFARPPIGRRGYNEDEVDALLARVAIQLGGYGRQRSVVDPGPRHLRQTDESTAQKIFDHIRAFLAELSVRNHTRFTWRTPLVFGVLSVFLGFAVHPAYLVVGAGLLIVAALTFYFRWGS
jgi:DivIVA domain-containing protein